MRINLPDRNWDIHGALQYALYIVDPIQLQRSSYSYAMSLYLVHVLQCERFKDV